MPHALMLRKFHTNSYRESNGLILRECTGKEELWTLAMDNYFHNLKMQESCSICQTLEVMKPWQQKGWTVDNFQLLVTKLLKQHKDSRFKKGGKAIISNKNFVNFHVGYP